MTDKAISPLRRRLIEDMTIRQLNPKTQLHYIRHVKRFADFLSRSADKATAEDIHCYQLWLASIGTTVPTVNVSATGVRRLWHRAIFSSGASRRRPLHARCGAGGISPPFSSARSLRRSAGPDMPPSSCSDVMASFAPG